MAYFIIRNSLNPYKSVKFSITLQQQVLKSSDGDPIWTAEINTVEPSLSGTGMKSKYLHLRTLNNLDQEIEKAASEFCEQIDWSPLLNDARPPYVTYTFPVNDAVDVDIDSGVEVKLSESLPSAGIDLSSIEVTVNGLDITSEVGVTGDPYEYVLRWRPSLVINT